MWIKNGKSLDWRYPL